MPGSDDPMLPERERERLRQRDRKRETRMVVDNAGVKRVRRAIAQRDPKPAPQPPEER
jgi:hypothetical protein